MMMLWKALMRDGFKGTLLLALYCLVFTSIGANATSPASSPRPNIVFIFADDLGIGDTSAYGSQVISTPNIDLLAASGARFSNGYVSHPVCSPSRAGLLTGQYQQRHGWEFNPAGKDMNGGMDPDQITMADMLKEAGYATGMVGKWHLGYTGRYHPLARGFDEYFGILAGGSSFIDPQYPGVETVGQVSKVRPPRVAVYDGEQPVVVEKYLTDVFTNKALSFIDRHQAEPFFLYLSHTAPHVPLQATAKYLQRYSHIDDKATRIYAAMVAALDDSVGAIVARLKVLGLHEKTLIVFASDNGCADYIKGACSNAPFAGFKRYHQEGGIRVPFVVSWPGRLPAGQTYDEPIISLDLFATFAAVAGSAVTTRDSVDLMPFVKGERSDSPHEYLYWRAGPTIAIRDNRWKLIRYNYTNLGTRDLDPAGRLPPPVGGWPTDSPQGQMTLLFDLLNDQGETKNLAAKHPQVVTRLSRAHAAWAEELRTKPILPATRSTLAQMFDRTVQLFF